ncbi:MAG: DUF3488 domain-containing transglutaminase family protein, partial [Burkholderiales bacterium]|nr:DUF3488 domain-containing transglutaminase family protein [Burkholderiales bacterium]
MPRDARDTLFQLAVIGWAVAPHLLHVPPWCAALSVALLGWRAWLALSGAALPRRWVVSALLALAAVLTLSAQHTLLGKEAGITMLVVLMALKMLELRARRDALVVFFLGFFLVLTNFLYSQSLATGLWLLVAVWGLLTALALAHMPVGRPPLARAAAVALRSALWGLPLMALLFVLFPRIGPLWGLPQDAAARTGLSGSMELGTMSQIAEDDAIAMRLRFFGPVPPADQMYFRGPVLSHFDGRTWTRLVPSVRVALRPRLELELRGPPLRYEITLEPSRQAMLPLLEMTPDLPGAAPHIEGWMLTQRPDGQWQTDRPVNERLRLQASAWLDYRHGPRQPVPGLADLLALPAGANPRTLQWAHALAQRPELAGATPARLAQAVLDHIRHGGYTYTLDPGTYDGPDVIDAFWIDRKRGFCEHFASAFVVVMRALGVPARIVTGYQGTDPAPQDGWWIVRQRDAHAWAEIWQQGKGWMRVDPTAAVAPDRIEHGHSLAPRPGLVAGTLVDLDPELAQRLRTALERLDNRWNQWVLNYAGCQQLDLLRALGYTAPSRQDLATLLILLLCTLALAGAGWAWWDRRRQDPWQRLQQRVQRRLQALGVAVAAHEDPRRRAAKVRAALGERGATLAALLDELDR